MDRPLLKQRLRTHENDIPSAYQDSEGYWTIGVGHLIDKRKGGKLSDRIRDLILDEDIDVVIAELDRALPWWSTKPPQVQSALAEMVFQLGMPALLGFHNALAALKADDYPTARAAFQDSHWAKEQTPQRASEVIALLTP